MLNGIEFQTVGAAYLKALRPTAVLVNGTCGEIMRCRSESSRRSVEVDEG